MTDVIWLEREEVVPTIVLSPDIPTITLSPVGAPGGIGPPGPAGFSYVHTQAVPATVWTIAHGLAGYPNVTTVDQSNRVYDADVEYIDANTITVTHTAIAAGAAFLS